MAYTHTLTPPEALHFTDDPESCALVATNPTALIIGFLLDQQITMEKAFQGPKLIRERIGTLDPGKLAAMDEDTLIEAFREKPAIHRFPAAKARAVQQAMQVIVDDYDGDTQAIWANASDMDDLIARLKELPGIGDQMSATIALVLVKFYGLPFSIDINLPPYGSLMDVTSQEKREEYQANKRAYKAKKRAQKQAKSKV